MRSNKCFLRRSLRFITLLSAIVALSCATSSTRLFAHTIAPPIGIPDIGWDSSPPGATGGQTTFTALTGALLMTGDIDKYIGPPAAPFLGGAVVGDTISISGSLVPGSVAVIGGVLLHADFVGGTLADVVVTDSAAVLALSGTLTSLSILGDIGFSTGHGGLLFTPTGGYLAPTFAPGGGAVFLEFNLDTTWAAGTYGANWTAETKGDMSPIPEPGTIALLGTGLLGMLAYGRKRFWKKG